MRRSGESEETARTHPRNWHQARAACGIRERYEVLLVPLAGRDVA